MVNDVHNSMASSAWRRDAGKLVHTALLFLAAVSILAGLDSCTNLKLPFPGFIGSCSGGAEGSKGPLLSYGCYLGDWTLLFIGPTTIHLSPAPNTYTSWFLGHFYRMPSSARNMELSK